MMRKIIQRAPRLAAIAVLGAVYGTAALLSRSCNRRGQGPRQRSGCILAIGTFHNPNWFHSHIRPLVRSGIGEVVLVCDEEVRAMIVAPLVHELDIESTVEFLGKRADVNDLLAMTRVFVLTSRWEGFMAPLFKAGGTVGFGKQRERRYRQALGAASSGCYCETTGGEWYRLCERWK